MRKSHMIALCLALIAMALYPVANALAYTERIYADYNGTNQHAHASKDTYLVDPTHWNSYIRSSMVLQGDVPGSGYPIGTIGWSYWAFGQRCNGTFYTFYQQGGNVSYNSSLKSDTGFASNITCNLYPLWDKTAWTVGTHDFKQTGKPNWAPSFDDPLTLPGS